MSTDPDLDTDQPASLSEAANTAYSELEAATPETTPALATPEEAPWEPPAFTARWSENARNAVKEFGTATHNRKYLEPILNQFEDHNKRYTQHQQEFSDYRKNIDPIYSVLQPLEQTYRLQGMSLQQGVSQLVEGAKFVASDPDQAFPYFASMYSPRNPADAVMGIAKAWGVDLGQLAQEQPYIDPTYQALITPLQKELAEVRQFTEQQRQAQAQEQARFNQQQQQLIVNKLKELEEQKDEAGNLRFPHLNTVFPDIEILAERGRFKTIEEAYDYAVMMNPELSQSVITDRAKAAEQKAIQEATAKSKAVQQEASSNRSVAGKGRPTEGVKNLSLRETAAEAFRELSAK